MFNFQNLNGLFNLAPETLSQINQAASVANVSQPAPTPSFTLPPNFNFSGMMQPAVQPTRAPEQPFITDTPAPAPAPAPVAAPSPAPVAQQQAGVTGGGGLSIVPSLEGYQKPDPDEYAQDYIGMYDEWDRLSGQAGNSEEELKGIYEAYYKSEAALYDAMAEFDKGNISAEQYAATSDNIFQEFKSTLESSGVSTGYKDRYRLSFPLFNQQLYGETLQGDIGFQKFSSDNDSVGGQLLEIGVIGGLSIIAGPQIGPALGLTGAPAAAAGAAITSSASQLMMTGEIDPAQALVSAAIAYGGAKLGEVMQAATEPGGVLADVGKQYDTFIEAVSGGNSIAQAAIEAGGISLLTQAVTNGSVDLKQAAIAAAMAGGAQAITELRASLKEFDFASDENFDDTFEEIDAELEAQGLVEITPTGEYKDIPESVQETLDAPDTDETLLTGDSDLTDTGPLPGDDLIYRDSGTYVDSEGNPVDSVTYSLEKDSYVDAITGETVTLQTDDGVYDLDGNLYAYQEDGQWFRGDGTLIDDPRVVDELVNISQKSGVAGEIQNLRAPENLGSTDVTYGKPFETNDPEYRGTIYGDTNDPSTQQDIYYDGENHYVYKPNENITVTYTELPPEIENKIESQKESFVEGAMPDVETSEPGGGDVTEATGGSEGGGPAGSADQTSGVPGTSLGAGSILSPAQIAAGITSPTAPIETPTETPAETAPTTEQGMLTFGGGSVVPPTTTPATTTPTTDQGMLTFGGAAIDPAGGGGAGDGSDTAGGGEGGESGQGEGIGSGGAGEGEGAGAGDDAGTGGGVGGGEGEGIGGGVGDGSGGEGGTGGGLGLDLGFGGGAGGVGGATSFEPFMAGISYETPAIGELIQSPDVDYNAQLNAVINRNVGLFEGMV